MATGINLAPGTQYITELRQRRQRLFVAAAVIAVAVLVVWVALYLFQRQLESQAGSINDRIRGVESEIAKLDTEAERIILFEKRLEDLDGLLNAHVSWNPLLTDLERLLPPTTTLTGLKVETTKNTMTLTGATPNVDEVASLLASLVSSPERKTVFQKASLTSIARRETKDADGQPVVVSYEFNADLSFDPNSVYINK